MKPVPPPGLVAVCDAKFEPLPRVNPPELTSLAKAEVSNVFNGASEKLYVTDPVLVALTVMEKSLV